MTPASMEIIIGLVALSAAVGVASAKMKDRTQGPIEGQAGKDIVWVPTPPALVEKMLDMAGVTASDRVVDLGSGDGRIVIAAARRGAHALGVEYDTALVDVARSNAAQQGVAERATFVQGDLYESDLADATVLALFLLPDNLRALEPKFRAMKAGTRIVTNRFGIPGWKPVDTCRIGGDAPECPTAVLYTVPESMPAQA